MKLELTLQRNKPTETSMIGSLWNESTFLAYTLEDIPRETKIMNQTSIPAGRYQVRMCFSNKFQKIMPLLMDVPNFQGIRIHGGNTDADTSGCILVGMHKGDNKIWDCAPALDKVYQLIAAAEMNGGTWIEIKNYTGA